MAAKEGKKGVGSWVASSFGGGGGGGVGFFLLLSFFLRPRRREGKDHLLSFVS